MAADKGDLVTLAGTMPPSNTNALRTYAKDLMADPTKCRLIVAMIDVVKTVTDHDKGVAYPVVRLRHVELVTSDNIAVASEILGGELAARTGAEQLPFEHGQVADDFAEGRPEDMDEVGGDAPPRLGIV
jgi:hypothetical protein